MSDIDSERNSLGGRVRRYARVGTAVGGLAARLAGERYLGLSVDKAEHAADLKAALGGLKGPLMKVAQILSTVPDALPKEYVDELSHLQSNAPAMGWPFVKRRMTTELGAGWQKKFAEFEREAASAASLGQVHRGVLHDGRKVAVKLQYPDMSSAVEADLRQLDWVFKLYRRYDTAIDPSLIHTELSARLREELDYGREARHMALYRHMLADEPAVHIPEVVDELSTSRLITMTWLDGTPFMKFLEENPDIETRNRVAHNMFRTWYVPFYFYGVIHGDPHLGNYTIRDDGSINLLDFGCIRVFPPAFVKGVIDLYRALRDDDEELAVQAYASWGFTDLDRETIDVLNVWARFLYGPLMEDRTRKIQESGSGLYGREIAEKVHGELKRLSGVRPPREFVLMDRAALGLGSVFMHLKAEVNWYRLFHELIGEFDVETLTERQDAALAAVGLERPE
ncbi:AarF/UbiB family protein [Thalassobaculum sp. OXR-137]|uniref:ABC1 kinase family protein n=1 Tax=Thalassobaculum sp. OXR-137 TaxID=3100173 RepID=UPI002AC8D625|nr:AarF/UbiB family protein [Thalassobaculum sp. OXR-137]WPZ36100.1 AarF/UbiB family protein [Thalassobaculum sp. OXR-137]